MYAKCITIDWQAISLAIGLHVHETTDLFSDGRLSGELLQRLAIRQFGLIASSNCKVYDAIFPVTHEKIEIRLITKRGIQTAPSNQIGAKRTFNLQEYQKKLESVEYFLFIDLRTVSSNIPCYIIPSSIIRRFHYKKKLSKVGATSSNKVISSLLMESIRVAWADGLDNKWFSAFTDSFKSPTGALRSLDGQSSVPLTGSP